MTAEQGYTAETLVTTITIPPGDEGVAYRLTLPDGRNVIVDEGGDVYCEIAGILDDAFDEVRP